ncbi:hypothetical protein GGP79_003194 [Salinibacter ruber]|jgi:hypothetical protein|nr:hypothetical protein [Salinibacter ruber]
MGAALFFWIVFSVLIGALASSWGRSGLGYFASSQTYRFLFLAFCTAQEGLVQKGGSNIDPLDMLRRG